MTGPKLDHTFPRSRSESAGVLQAAGGQPVCWASPRRACRPPGSVALAREAERGATPGSAALRCAECGAEMFPSLEQPQFNRAPRSPHCLPRMPWKIS